MLISFVGMMLYKLMWVRIAIIALVCIIILINFKKTKNFILKLIRKKEPEEMIEESENKLQNEVNEEQQDNQEEKISEKTENKQENEVDNNLEKEQEKETI
jgi:ABC-type bacteriocin/lantibiotic exporter with double-glycine peptidase domain